MCETTWGGQICHTTNLIQLIPPLSISSPSFRICIFTTYFPSIQSFQQHTYGLYWTTQSIGINFTVLLALIVIDGRVMESNTCTHWTTWTVITGVPPSACHTLHLRQFWRTIQTGEVRPPDPTRPHLPHSHTLTGLLPDWPMQVCSKALSCHHQKSDISIACLYDCLP